MQRDSVGLSGLNEELKQVVKSSKNASGNLNPKAPTEQVYKYKAQIDYHLTWDNPKENRKE